MTAYIIVFILGLFVGVVVGNKKFRNKLFKEIKKLGRAK